MESKQFPSNKKFISIKEEKFIRKFDYDSNRDATCFPKKHLLLEILQKGTNFRQSSQKILVSIKPKAPAIKTLYIAEKRRFFSKQSSTKSGSRLAIGDHLSFTSRFSEDNTNIRNSITHRKYSTGSSQFKHLSSSSKCLFNNNTLFRDVYEKTQRQEVRKCCKDDRPSLTMNISKVAQGTEKENPNPKKVDIATLVVTNAHCKDTLPTVSGAINKLHRRIDHLERKILRQQTVFRSYDHNIQLSSSDEEMNDEIMRSTSGIGHPGCSYIEQYSHIPKSSAFQRYSQGSPGTQSKTKALDKDHNSEQYGRDFTTYDGITARGRRQSASVPCKRDDIPKVAAERVHKIRHKLNPVRDYRLMDTVHYLAQGEFAPRDDGIKLTPSREAVLSDIIWEDVCRTHWPNTRLGRRIPHSDRHNARGELQRLIDNLLRERVAHVERRKRRHYRIVKLNNRHENCRTVGKTGDIIVASNKKEVSNRDLIINDHKATSAVMTDKHRRKDIRRDHKSYERLIIPGMTATVQTPREKCSPGPSYAADLTSKKTTTNCYNTCTPNNNTINTTPSSSKGNKMQCLSSSSSMSAYKAGYGKPRLIVKKENLRRKSVLKEEPNLEQFILLPTLVVRTPSNMKRQKKFSELYHRILNVHINQGQKVDANTPKSETSTIPNKKDIGLNINITLSDSEEEITGK